MSIRLHTQGLGAEPCNERVFLYPRAAFVWSITLLCSPFKVPSRLVIYFFPPAESFCFCILLSGSHCAHISTRGLAGTAKGPVQIRVPHWSRKILSSFTAEGCRVPGRLGEKRSGCCRHCAGRGGNDSPSGLVSILPPCPAAHGEAELLAAAEAVELI